MAAYYWYSPREALARGTLASILNSRAFIYTNVTYDSNPPPSAPDALLMQEEGSGVTALRLVATTALGARTEVTNAGYQYARDHGIALESGSSRERHIAALIGHIACNDEPRILKYLLERSAPKP